MSVLICPANEVAQDDILSLLEKFYPVRSHWEKLFLKRHWGTENDIIGYVICDNKNIVGYLGVILSPISLPTAKNNRICNISTWYVEPQYRQYSLFLLKKVLEMKGVTWTNLTPSASAYQLFLRYGFKPFATHQRVILPLPKLVCNSSIIINQDIIPHLDAVNKQIYLNHKGLNCIHVLLRGKHACCYLILVKTQYKKLPVAKIYYVSNKENFHSLFAQAYFRLCVQLKVCYLLVENFFLDKFPIPGSFVKKLEQPRLYKSDFLVADQISLLNSELMVLGI